MFLSSFNISARWSSGKKVSGLLLLNPDNKKKQSFSSSYVESRESHVNKNPHTLHYILKI
jgi:hypothetical protein